MKIPVHEDGIPVFKVKVTQQLDSRFPLCAEATTRIQPIPLVFLVDGPLLYQVTFLRGDRLTKTTSTAIFVDQATRMLDTQVLLEKEEVCPGQDASAIIQVGGVLFFTFILLFTCGLFCGGLTFCCDVIMVSFSMQVQDFAERPVPNATVCLVAVDHVSDWGR